MWHLCLRNAFLFPETEKQLFVLLIPWCHLFHQRESRPLFCICSFVLWLVCETESLSSWGQCRVGSLGFPDLPFCGHLLTVALISNSFYHGKLENLILWHILYKEEAPNNFKSVQWWQGKGNRKLHFSFKVKAVSLHLNFSKFTNSVEII